MNTAQSLQSEIVMRLSRTEENKPQLPRDEVDDIRDAVYEYLNIQAEEGNNKCRKRELVQARQISMFFAKSLTKRSLSHIGAKIGNKDHATVLHACRSVNNLMDTDKKYREQIDELSHILLTFTNRCEEIYYNTQTGMHYSIVHTIRNLRDAICWIVKDARRMDGNILMEASDVENMRRVTHAMVEGQQVEIIKCYYAESHIIDETYCETWNVQTHDRRIKTITFPRNQINLYLITEERV